MDTQVITTIIGVAASILALSIVVQILQEMYKYLTSSQSRLYVNVLRDHMGSIAKEIAFAPEFANLRTRGPFEFLRRRPTGRLLPLSAEDLRAAAEKTAPPWVQRTLEQLRLEAAGEATAEPSAWWTAFLEKLGIVGRGSPGYETAREIADFLSEHGHRWEPGEELVGEITFDKKSAGTFDPSLLMKALEMRFVPHITKAMDNMPLLDNHLAYAGGRRNMRHTVVIGFLVAAIIGLPIQDVYRHAAKASPEETVEFAQSVTNLYDRWNPEGAPGAGSGQFTPSDSAARGPGSIELRAAIDSLLQPLVKRMKAYDERTRPDEMMVIIGTSAWQLRYRGFWDKLLYIIGSIGTAILVGFGAPFWNDILKSVLGLKRSLQSARTNAKS